MNIVHRNSQNKKLQLQGALNIQETPAYKQKKLKKIMLINKTANLRTR